MSETSPPRLLIKMPPAVREALEGQPLRLAGNTFRLRPLCPNEGLGERPGVAPTARWYVAETTPGAATVAELWEQAHQAVAAKGAPTAAAGVYIEPDLLNPWPYDNPTRCAGPGAAPGDTCVFDPQAADLPQGPEFAWHLRRDYSQLQEARKRVADAGPAPVRLGIMDVGFDFTHQAKPERLIETDLWRNFVDDGRPPNDVSDPYDRGLFKNPGHGTATIAILAGGLLSGMIPEANTNDYLGGAPLAEVMPVRIATSVILLRTSAFVRGLDYLIAPYPYKDKDEPDPGDPSLRPDVVSMSMGGLASKAWAEVVNRAYEAGICLVTAAGNNFLGTPQSIVYPARFRRVIAACGVMANGRPYIRGEVPLQRMAGNYGPDSKMDTTLAAYTPNMPWAEINCPTIVDMNGAGTSAATPQIAAAAALWLQKYKGQLQYTEPWQVVEAVRQALFASAKKDTPDCHTFFGQGILKAAEALAVQPAVQVTITPADEVSLPFLRVLTGVGVAAAPGTEMLEVEALQLLQRDELIEKTIKDPDRPEITKKEKKAFLEAAIASELASPTLKKHLKGVYAASKFATPLPGAQKDSELPPPITERKVHTPRPMCRRLRGFAFDPELSTRLETAHINAVVFEVPWEKVEPGPSGEYVEVIDHDPASGCFYAPVDLNNQFLLAADGLPPAEGDPKFHQQMVYAVAMRTIHNFEIALGRKALWSPRMRGKDDRQDVPKLRIYPHALRERNAYYDPEKKALLFGYFPATTADPGQQYPGGMVFTCLSHDIVAHETTHALLDGMHRNFIQPSNEDQLAFHEAFADIVALFQHFSMPQVLHHQIAKTRGDMRTRNLLGELAQQFGQASGMRGALRSAIGEVDEKTGEWRPLTPDPSLYVTETEPHARGALLVAAVFDAFLSIYEARTADLLRLATTGTGILPSGAIHPDLVGRLSEEAAMASQHVLNICIRALDYCPPVDLTFGDYLRALITSDYDLVRDDTYGYRVAFVEAFRRRGIYPRDLRSLSVEALRWRPARENLEGEDKDTDPFQPILLKLRAFAEEFRYLESRKEMFHRTRAWRIKLHRELERLFQSLSKEQRLKLMSALGLDLTTGKERFEVHALRVSDRQGPDETPRPPKILLSLVQEHLVAGESSGGGQPFLFSAGCTIIADQRKGTVDYFVSKSILSEERLSRQRTFNARFSQPLAAVYFGASPLTGEAQRFAMLHADTEVY